MLTNELLKEITPDNYQDIYKNKRFHHSLKGCDIELRILKSGRPGEKKIYTIRKYCKTHNKECLRSGWEIHYWQNNYLVNEEKYCLNCGEQISNKYDNIKYCKECKPIVYGFVSYLHRSYYKKNYIIYYNINELNISILNYYKEKYKDSKFSKLIDFNIKSYPQATT